MQKQIEILINDLKNIFGERLVSIILHGSFVRETFIKGVSDINLIVVVENLTSTDLNSAKYATKKWITTKNPAPVFMDKAEWCSSNDVYALEYSDILENYGIIYGEDIVKSLVLNTDNIRFQCESEIKHHLLRLRSAYVSGMDCSKLVESIVNRTISSYLTIIRGIIKVLELKVPGNNEELLDLFTEKSSIYSGLFQKIIEKRQSKKKFAAKESEEIVKKLIDTLSKMLKFVDEINKENCYEK